MADAENAAPVADVAQEVATEPVQEGQEGEVQASPEGQPQATDAQVQQVAQKIKQLKLKVDGQELIEDLPFEVTPEQAEYLKKELQMSKMASKRAQEAAELRKNSQKRESELNNFLDLLKENPQLILKEMGKNPLELAEKWLQEEVEKMQMDPKERRIKELEAEMKKIADEKTAAKKAHEEAQAKIVRDKYASDFESQLMNAMKSGSLPNNPELINRMTNYMAKAIEQGIDVSFEDIIPIVKNSHRELVKSSLKDFSAQELLELMSEAQVNDLVIKKMPKAEKKKAPPTAQSVQDSGERVEVDSGPKFRRQSSTEFFRKLGV